MAMIRRRSLRLALAAMMLAGWLPCGNVHAQAQKGKIHKVGIQVSRNDKAQGYAYIGP